MQGSVAVADRAPSREFRVTALEEMIVDSRPWRLESVRRPGRRSAGLVGGGRAGRERRGYGGGNGRGGGRGRLAFHDGIIIA